MHLGCDDFVVRIQHVLVRTQNKSFSRPHALTAAVAVTYDPRNLLEPAVLLSTVFLAT
jgi:hypothetical protein